MSIITKCPACGTTFRVTPPQLQAQHGMVRCGRCASVFDGFKTLATLPDATLPDIKQAEAAPQDIAVREAPADEEVTAAPRADAGPAPETITPAAAEHDAPITIPFDELTEQRALVQAPVAARDRRPSAQPVVAAPPARRRAGGWAFGAVLLLVALAVQGAYFYRSDIAASVPEARPYLGKMCELMRCAVALPQRPRQISIEASDMQATDPASPGLIALTATLRNQATIELGYPALDVVLTNTKEHTVARRIFLPAEYLVAGKDPRAGIAPNAEITVRLNLDTGDLGAAGFRLDLIAAPAP
jgi:predicted Zn finger-like uncharacterized protein